MPLSPQQSDILIALARDISDGDPQIMSSVRRMVDNPPPLEPEEMGFYPRGDEDEYERAIRGTVFVLNGGIQEAETAPVLAFEDKYIDEALPLMVDAGLIDRDKLPLELCETIDGFWEVFEDRAEAETSGEKAKVKEKWLPSIVALMRAVNGQAAADKKILLSFDLGAGDSWYVFAMPLEKAARWQDVELHKTTVDEVLAIRSLDWSLFLEFLSGSSDIFTASDLPDELGHKALSPAS